MDPEYSGYLLTWNPDKWDDGGWIAEAAAQSLRGVRPGVERWSSAGRRHGYTEGDRIFLLKQGREPRGIVGSGWIDHNDGTYDAKHWDESGRLTIYINVDWEYFVDPNNTLPTADLQAAATHTNWRPQGSGAVIAAEDLAVVERLWAEHTGLTEPEPRPGQQGHRFGRPGSQHPVSAGWQRDPDLRRKAEDYAQQLLEHSFRDDKWRVEDTRYGKPFDAIARRAREVRYLEAKGTMSDGRSVQVTAGEVNSAQDHPGECVIGIVSGIRFDENREVIADSGTLVTRDWCPDEADLATIAYRWTPPPGPVARRAAHWPCGPPRRSATSW